MANTNVRPTDSSSSLRPPQLWLAVLLVSGAGAAVLVVTGILLNGLAPLVATGGSLRAFTVLWLLLASEFGAVGFGLVAMAWLMIRGDAVGWVVSLLLSASVGIAELITPARTFAQNVAMVVGFATCLLLLEPGIRRYFLATDRRPVGVVAAVLLVGFFAFSIGLTGLALIALESYSKHDAAIGVGLLLGALLLFWLNRQLRFGNAVARAVVSLLLIAMAILVLIPANRNLGPLILAVLAAGALGGLWLPPTSQEHFASSAASFSRLDPLETAPAKGQWAIGGGFVVLAVIIVAAALSGNSPSGAGSSAATVITTAPNYVSNTTPNGNSGETPATTPADNYVRTWSLTATATGGYTESAELQVGTPEKYQEGLTNGNDTIGSACTVDNTDAVIPYQLTVTNTTASFSTYVAVTFEGVGQDSMSGSATSELDAEASYSSGAQCVDSSSNSTFGLDSTDLLTPNENVQIDGFFIITNYYSPDQPNGNPALLQQAVLSLEQSQGADGAGNSGTGQTFNINQVSGPGIEKSGGGFDGMTWQFDLAGTAIATGNSGNSGTAGNSG